MTNRLLVLTPYAPGVSYGHAADDIALPYFAELAEHFELHVAAPIAGVPPVGLPYELHALPPAHRGLWQYPGSYPWGLRTSWSRAATRAADRLIAELHPDYLHLEYLQPGEVVSRYSGPFSVTLHDLTTAVFDAKRKHARGLPRLHRALEYRRVAFLEDQVVRAATHVFLLSPDDQDAISNRVASSSYLPLGVSNPADSWQWPEVDHPIFSFTGALWREPNALAVRWLVDEVMPRVWRSEPTARLVVVGARPSLTLMRTMESDERLELHADVEDVAPFITRAHATAAPSMVPAGVLLKVLNAMAAGAPVVVNSFAAAGLGPGIPDLPIADSAQDFAEALVRLYRDRLHAEAVGRLGRAHIAEYHSWSAYVGHMRRSLGEVERS